MIKGQHPNQLVIATRIGQTILIKFKEFQGTFKKLIYILLTRDTSKTKSCKQFEEKKWK